MDMVYFSRVASLQYELAIIEALSLCQINILPDIGSHYKKNIVRAILIGRTLLRAHGRWSHLSPLSENRRR